MPNTTTNLQLKKPLSTEAYNIEDFNYNADILDAAIKADRDALALKANTADIPTIPSCLPANGGNSSTVNGKTVETNVPANAIFTDTTYSTATQITDGLMSKTDKNKLDGIATNANNYTHPSTHAPIIIAQDENNRFVSDTEKTIWNNKASKLHTSTDNTYGLGNEGYYGHTKILNNLTRSVNVSGESLSAYQGYVLNTTKSSMVMSTTAPSTTLAANVLHCVYE